MITFDEVTKAFPGGTSQSTTSRSSCPPGRSPSSSGPSGCGKTTSLRMINRTIEPTSGTISIDGEDVTKQDAALLRRRIGYVIQNAGLFPHRTIVDNIADRPAAQRREQEAGPRGGGRAAHPGRARRVDGEPLPRPALRRPAAARRRGPSPGRRPAGDADGRAVQRRRPDRAGQPPAGVPPAAVRARQDHRVRHPRHRRGRSSSGTTSRSCARAATWRSSARPRRSSTARPTSSSRTSSAATAASARCPS